MGGRPALETRLSITAIAKSRVDRAERREMRDFARDWDSAIAKAVFKCAQCGEVAAHVALIIDEPRSGLIAESDFLGEWTQVVLESGLRPLAQALNRADAPALYAVEALWAPFYCSECRACYCHEHWRMHVIFDEDWPDWYDCTEGTCPMGHRRLVDD